MARFSAFACFFFFFCPRSGRFECNLLCRSPDDSFPEFSGKEKATLFSAMSEKIR